MLLDIRREWSKNDFIISLGLAAPLRTVGGRRLKFGTQSRADCVEKLSGQLCAAVRH